MMALIGANGEIRQSRPVEGERIEFHFPINAEKDDIAGLDVRFSMA